MVRKLFENKVKEHQRGLVAIIITAVMWSTGGLFIKLISLDAYQLSFYRSIFSALTFFILFREKVFRFNWLTFANSIFYAGILILFVVATKITTAANAIFLQYTAPIYVLIFEPVFLKIPMRKINVISVIICFAGMSLFFIGEITPAHFEGNIIALLSGICFAAFLIGVRKNSSEFTLPSIFLGNVFVSLICLNSVFPSFQISINDFWMVAFLGIFQIGLAYALFSYAIKRIEGVEAALIAMLEPILNPIWVLLGYGEIPSAFAVIGGTIILATIAIRAFFIETKP
ncbi:MAG: DMT family transporter [Bacteroidetes bacterium]|nr:DMT family transporter [Bacteroidota bacterium]